MRGCFSAGMVGALYYLGLEDTFDVFMDHRQGRLLGRISILGNFHGLVLKSIMIV